MLLTERDRQFGCLRELIAAMPQGQSVPFGLLWQLFQGDGREIIRPGCGDATVKVIPTGIGTDYTGTPVEFGREAGSLEKTIESAMRDIEAVPGLHATGITIPAPERDEPGPGETGAVVSRPGLSQAQALTLTRTWKALMGRERGGVDPAASG